MLCYDSRAHQEEEQLFFHGKASANEKPWILFTRTLHTSFSLYKSALLPLPLGGTCRWLTIIKDFELQFSADPK